MSKNNNNTKRQDIDVERVAKEAPTTGAPTNTPSAATPKVAPVKQPAISVNVRNAVEPAVTDILSNRNTTLKDKLYEIAKLNTQCGKLAQKLIDYETKMGVHVKDIDAKKGASNNVSLYNTLNRVIHTAGGLEFDQKFQIVNIAFIVFKDSAYSIFKLNRFDFQWSYGLDNLQTYRNLIMLISELADITTRQEKVRRISWARIFSARGFRSVARNNLKKFYEK